ncbi:MAG: hypothetical protein WAW08_06220 [Candidatus Microthrix parvicella]
MANRMSPESILYNRVDYLLSSLVSNTPENINFKPYYTALMLRFVHDMDFWKIESLFFDDIELDVFELLIDWFCRFIEDNKLDFGDDDYDNYLKIITRDEEVLKWRTDHHDELMR